LHTRHHANPNREGSDPDLAVPAITFSPPQIAAARTPVSRWLIAHQGIFFFPILPFEGLSLHASNVRRLFLREHLDHRWVEIGFLFVRIASYLTMVLFVLSPDKAAVFLAIQLGLFGVFMGMSFAPNHKGITMFRIRRPAGHEVFWPGGVRMTTCWVARVIGRLERSNPPKDAV
jgi:hypothetical protein